MIMVNPMGFIKRMLKRCKRKRYLIGVSSGHSKKSMGAFCEITNKYEYEYIGELSVKLVELLKTLGYRVYSPDLVSDELAYPLHLRRSVELLNEHQVDIALELHLNKFRDIKAKGCETLTNEQGIPLATIIQEELVKQFKFKDRGIKQPKNKYFLKKIEGPSIIIEPLFLSNNTDVTILEKPEFSTDLCLSVVISLDRYFGVT